MNKPSETDAVPAEVSQDDMSSKLDASEQELTKEDENISMITPADMSEEAQKEMYAKIIDYNKCMMKNRTEYHEPGVRPETVADKTLKACDARLDELKVVLATNNVNHDLSEGMAKTIRQRAARKLMSNIMTLMAGEASVVNNAPAAPVTP